jgi:integrase
MLLGQIPFASSTAAQGVDQAQALVEFRVCAGSSRGISVERLEELAPSLRGGKSELRSKRVGRIVSKIGASAGIRVHVNPTDPKKVKYASAHDLRRAFGERWAVQIMPAQLREIMRHESIETTLRCYVGANAEGTADVCWEAFDRVGGAAPSPVVQNGVSGACG